MVLSHALQTIETPKGSLFENVTVRSAATPFPASPDTAPRAIKAAGARLIVLPARSEQEIWSFPREGAIAITYTEQFLWSSRCLNRVAHTCIVVLAGGVVINRPEG
jgi:hypothetical protein